MIRHRKAIGSAALLLAATLTAEGQTPADTTQTIQEQQLGSVSVVARRKKNTETAAITAERRALVVQNTVSAQLISRTQDKDASEVIRRIPGISLVDGKFVMVRGLSQRYNNVWINGAAVPSSEPDSRAFSFDIIPSSQIDNLAIVKSPAAEYPADYTGGFIMINTKDLPDRRLVEFNDRTDQTMGLYSADREFTRLDEHIASAAANWKRRYDWWHTNPTLKAGAYAEYRTRDYRTRDFYYTWDPYLTTLPGGFQFTDQITDIMQPDNYGADKLYMKEEVNYTNNYKAHGTQAAGYVAMSVPVGALDVYGGLRYEFSRTELITNTRQTEPSPISTFYTYHDLFPSLNLNYHLADKQQVRLSAGRTVNRPEFRELSPVVFYDFDLASNVQGNADLKPAYIANLDLRYEWYPSAGEMLSVAVFYKHFKNPIEWTYTVAGGTNLIYSNKNAKAAHNAGIELDLRKSLGFMGLPDFSLSLNASYIYSHVMFEKGSKERNRAMQGQSPYLINAGIFYQGRRNGWSAAILYNRIGKRIVGVGRSLGTTGSEDTKNIPDSYEMPRDAIDLTASKKIGKWQISAAIRDVLAQYVKFQQIETISNANGTQEIDEVTKRYKPGRNFSLSATYNF